MSAPAAMADTKIRTHCGILSSRQDHTKGARPRKRGGDAPGCGGPASRQGARPSVRQHTVSRMSPSLTIPHACLAWRLRNFWANRHQ